MPIQSWSRVRRCVRPSQAPSQYRAIVAEYREPNSEGAIRVVVGIEQMERYKELIAGVHAWLHLRSVADLDGFATEVETANRCAEPAAAGKR